MSDHSVLRRAAFYIMFRLVGIVVLLRVLLFEHGPPTPGAFRRYPPSEGLFSSEKEYVDWAGGNIFWVIRVARVRSIRFTVVAMISGVSALAVTLAIAVRTPGWVPAVLGFIAATGQYWQGVSRDREQAHYGHQLAIKLQKTLRDFHTDAGELSGQRLHERFKEFRHEFEKIKEEYGSEIIKIRGQDSQIGEQSPEGRVITQPPRTSTR